MTEPPGTGEDMDTGPILEQAGIPRSRVASLEPVGGGTYNTLLRVCTTDGTRSMLKLPPRSHTAGLEYEHGLLTGEVTYYRRAAGLHGVPVPSVLHCRLHDEDGLRKHLLMSERPGSAWNTLADTMPAHERSRLRRSLGRTLARAHSVTGPGFGYPAESVAALSPGWRTAFTAMLEAVLRDADRYSAWLPVPHSAVRSALRSAAMALDEVETPVLVHFDLWEGNILLQGPPGEREISGIVDGERMFWGDPLAELPSLHVTGAAEDDPDLMAGYLGATAHRLDDSARARIQLYRSYLYLIMLVETVPRRTSRKETEWLRTHIGGALKAALSTAARLTGS
ncbi:aminoglycoside phosphotransferase family protein [Streptomyces sp. HNM0575]|uniref:phosphotransferase family protein n=1 Tax=Streptomyces sp. HNM0575 TaxID=2716338 RepID=UPI00145CAA7A|nr:aminoglycoside phosphotransferase family protein [Streptomyces sp. HNM0575]NLU75952.1 aminoglycoside phosphotransferase family protein [Streptomyces sp. HNM0575]